VVALALLGIISLGLTWRNINAQREAAYGHMRLAAQSILRGFDAGLMQGMGRFLRHGGDPENLPPLLRELFQEIVGAEDVLFVALYGPEGKLWLSSHKTGGKAPAETLPPEALRSLRETGRWRERAELAGQPALLAAMRATPMGRGRMMGRMRHMGPMHGPGMIRGPQYLVMALDPQAHLALFRSYRRAALIQTGFVLLAGAALWLLAFSYLRRRDASRRVEELERFQSRLLDHMPDGLATLSSEGEVLSANPSAARLLGQGGGVVGRRLEELLPSAQPCPAPPARPAEQSWFETDTGQKRLELSCVALDPETGGGDRLLLLRDRTAVKALEEELAESKRLAAIGSLAAGVAHEIRNPLGSLRGFAQLFASKLADQPPLGEYAATMVQEADRLNRVVTDLLYLAKPRELKPQAVDVKTVADALARLMHFDLEHANAELDVDLEADTVYADPDGLTQALLNLTANALDALPDEGGTVRIASRRSQEETVLEVRDDGQGMDAETAAQAFEPFFSGKESGTGLGLAIVKNIAAALGGRVELDSAPGRGTTVALRLPAAPRPRPEEASGEG
jgi:two-component system sensor histidine kinase HydH